MLNKDGFYCLAPAEIRFLGKKGMVKKTVKSVDDLMKVCIWHLEQCEKNGFMQNESHFDINFSQICKIMDKVEGELI